MKLLTVQVPPFSSYIIHLVSKYSPQTLDLKHPLPLMGETKFHTHTKQLVELWLFVCFNIYIPRQQAEDIS
jgi:hypothetical protein